MISFKIVNQTSSCTTAGGLDLPQGLVGFLVAETHPPVLPLSHLMVQRAPHQEAAKEEPLCLVTSLNGPTEALASLATLQGPGDIIKEHRKPMQ